MALPRKPSKHKVPLEKQLVFLCLLSSVPLFLTLLFVLLLSDVSPWLTALVMFLSLIMITWCTSQIYRRSVYQFYSLSNLLDALISGDYSMRARVSKGKGALDILSESINQLAERLMSQRTQSVETQKLLSKVIDYIDVAIIALNENGQVRFVNNATRVLFDIKNEDDEALLARQLLFAQGFTAGQHDVIELAIGQKQGKFKIHVEGFREEGKSNLLLFITDVHTLLRSEQNDAWQSLVRVISHEINNSLSPIASISETLSKLVSKRISEADGHADPQQLASKTQLSSKIQSPEVESLSGIESEIINGLRIIAQRAKGLGAFVNSYKQLAKLPEPNLEKLDIAELLHSIAMMFPGKSILVEVDQNVEVNLDKSQIQQVLINLVKNAFEAMASLDDNSREVSIKCHAASSLLTIDVIDKGQGIANYDNLFVPFYTTKKQGSGIGLLLSRQVVEAHGGRLTLKNNSLKNNSLKNNQGPGCTANIEIPL